MAKGNKVFRKVMEGTRNRSAAPETPAEEARRKRQEEHLAQVKAQGEAEKRRLAKDEEQARLYQEREAERRRRKDDK